MTDPLFLSIALVTVVASIIALESRELVYGAVALSISFLGVAAVFVMLDALLLAVFQALVYVGSIAVLIVFVVMLVRKEKWASVKYGNERFLGIITSFVVVIVGLYVIYGSKISNSVITSVTAPSFYEIGFQMFNEYWLGLILTGLILAVAVVGALTMAKYER